MLISKLLKDHLEALKERDGYVAYLRWKIEELST